MTAQLSGPITGGVHGWPFAAALVDLGERGYVEEEWFVDGEARRFDPVGELGADGKWSGEPAGTAPFVTRALVRRPADPARFNGTVIVEWNNVSAGCEIAEAGECTVIFDEGFAWIGVSAQHVGVHGFPEAPRGLLSWDAERYGRLHIDDDALSYDIFATVAAALAGPDRQADGSPLSGLDAHRLLAVGGSQSASRLVTYVNAFHQRDRLFDGYIVFTWFGSGSSVDDPAIYNPADPASRASLTRHVTTIRDDLDVPVLVVNSECETGSCVGVRRPDTSSYVFWEVAGAAHGPRLHMEERILPKLDRDGLSLSGDVVIDVEALNPVPWAPVLDAGIGHLQRWMRGGDPPPSQPLIEVDAGAPPKIRRDADGNALGGLRVPEMEVPLGQSIGAAEEAGAAGLMGIWRPFTAEEVRRRYPTEEAFVAAFDAAVGASVKAQLMLAADGPEALANATERYRAAVG